MPVQDALQLLADPTRRRIFERLRRGPLPVGRIAEDLPVTRPAVSQHLKALRQGGLVREERQGTRHLYSIDTAGLADLRKYVESFWDDVLSSFKLEAERQTKRKPQWHSSRSGKK